MKKGKIKTLTETNSDYVSEKKIDINGEEAWLVKTNNHIRVTNGKKVLFDGRSNDYHRWLRKLKYPENFKINPH
jgi:hypothetical protein